MANHPKTERTFVLIKPDGLQRTLVGEIMRRYERLGLKLVGIKMLVPTAEHIEKHEQSQGRKSQSLGIDSGKKWIMQIAARYLREQSHGNQQTNQITIRCNCTYNMATPLLCIGIERALFWKSGCNAR